ncbi:MAG: gamma-glutamyltransferase, partial [Candidatus Heimdallarchaeota archaeon]|nr:gamma-glutamyltransferase [Candidatus Heimdallarchaeota archaeon]
MSVNFWRRPFSGRSAVHAKNGMVASSQPLATSTGLQILQAGGNACDAIVATAAVLNVVEPFSTGIGGDAFALLHIPGEKRPLAINGSGYSFKNLSYDHLVNEEGLKEIPLTGVLPITVPGALSMWAIMHDKYGVLDWKDVLTPAINYAKFGFPVSPVIAQVWGELVPKLMQHEGSKKNYLIENERSPREGEIFKQRALAKTFEIIANDGKDAFYRGEISNRIVNFLQKEGSRITSSDLVDFSAEWTEPISQDIYDHILWEHGPNGQGLVTLQILAIAEEYDIAQYPLNSVNYLHCLIEAKKLAFSDAYAYLSDPVSMKVNVAEFLNDSYAQIRASQINP